MSLFEEDHAPNFMSNKEENDHDRSLDETFELISDNKGELLSSGSTKTTLTFEDTESIRKWRIDQAEEISERDAEAEKTMQDWRAGALKELDNWHAKQNEVLQNKKEVIREAQMEFVKEVQEQKPGQQWERICNLCDFNPKGNRNVKDTSRMRSVLLHLKQNPLIRA